MLFKHCKTFYWQRSRLWEESKESKLPRMQLRCFMGIPREGKLEMLQWDVLSAQQHILFCSWPVIPVPALPACLPPAATALTGLVSCAASFSKVTVCIFPLPLTPKHLPCHSSPSPLIPITSEVHSVTWILYLH